MALANKRILVLGSGPIRIGQGIEFDYASVQCVWALKKLGYEVAIVNNNPETVSTDFDTADRLYFEPLTPEDVMGIIRTENPLGVVVAFGGQTAIKLTKFLHNQGITILGTSADSIDMAEDRERFDALLERLGIKRPQGFSVRTFDGALEAAGKLSYPVLLRPSYVLGGQNMIIAFNDDDVREYMAIILGQGIENPVLIDKYLMGSELEVDAICDGEDILIPGVMEHIERTGIHSGDSIAVYPAWNVNDIMTEKIVNQSRLLALALGTRGLVNIQYLIHENELYIIEVNPRSSRTIPYISKVTGIPMVELAVRAMLGEKLRDMGFGTGLSPAPPYFAVKVPVFSFEKLSDVDTQLGPEMKSTGEVLGIGRTMDEALYKGLVAAGYRMTRPAGGQTAGGVLLTVRKADQFEIVDTARGFYELGFKLYATEGTAKVIGGFGMDVQVVNKIHENSGDNTLTLLDTGKIDYVVSTSARGRIPTNDSVQLRRKAVERDIPCLTSIDTANAIVRSLMSRYSPSSLELVDCNNLKRGKQKLSFSKMQSTGNDFIVFDAMTQSITNPEGLAVRLCDRRTGIGADSLVLVTPPTDSRADAGMRFFNQDGSEGLMAGNAIRCVAKYVYDNNVRGIADRHDPRKNTAQIAVETASGIKNLLLYKQNGKVSSVRVDMGKPEFLPEQIPAALPLAAVEAEANASASADPNALNAEACRAPLPSQAVINAPIVVEGMEYRVTALAVGNPHCVVFSGFVDKVDVARVGPRFENHEAFPDRVNTEFVRVASRNCIKMRVWERGNGETPACGTGACAAAIAAVLNGYCPANEDITVKVRGGDLTVNFTGDTVYLTGQTGLVYHGEIEV